MKCFACVLLGLLFITALSVSAQGNAPATPLNSFAFGYTAHFAVEGLSTFAIKADLSGSGVLDRSALAFDLSLKGNTVLGTAQKDSVDEELRWVNDTLYLNTGDGWQARDGASAYAADLLSQYSALSVDSAAVSKWDASGIDGLSAIISALTSADPTTFANVQHLADEGDTAHFQTTLDLHALMQTDDFVDAVAAVASAQGNNLVIYKHADLAKIVRTNSALFQNATVVLDQYIGLGDHLPHRLALTLNMPLDPTKIGYPNAPFTVTASFDVTLSDLNQPQTVAVPEEAKLATEFTFPAPPALPDAGAGDMLYVFFSQTGENTPSEQTFEAQAGDTVTITASGLELEYDSELTLLSPDGTTLAENNDHDTPSFALGDYESQIGDFTIPKSGTYTVRVSEYDGAAGSFVLSINLQR
jgi:Bacterial pre-peptidase C-terminal domain